jgi:hypothetical protein
VNLHTAFSESLKMAVEALEQQEADQWIPVIKLLPDKNKLVLIYAKSMSRGGFVYTFGTVSNGCWFTESGVGMVSYPNGNNYEVIAWRPLPKPYQE